MQDQVIRSLTGWDYTVIVFYFGFIVVVGYLFKHVNRDASDYFRGGGNMLWRISVRKYREMPDAEV